MKNLVFQKNDSSNTSIKKITYFKIFKTKINTLSTYMLDNITKSSFSVVCIVVFLYH